MNPDFFIKQRRSAERQRHIPAIPVQLSQPVEEGQVRFWTCHRLQPESTTVDNSLSGTFRGGAFWSGEDHWSRHEVDCWSYLPESNKTESNGVRVA